MAQNELIQSDRKEYYTKLFHELLKEMEGKNHWRAAEKAYEIAIQYFSDEKQKEINYQGLAIICEKLADIESSVMKLNYIRKAITSYRQSGNITHKNKIETLQSQLPELTKQIWSGNMHRYQVRTTVTASVNSLQEKLINLSLKEQIIEMLNVDNFLTQDEALELSKDVLANTMTNTAIGEIYDADFNLQSSSKDRENDNATLQEFHFLKAGRLSTRTGFLDFIRIMIIQEHNPDFSDIEYLYSNSAWIPIDHETQI